MHYKLPSIFRICFSTIAVIKGDFFKFWKILVFDSKYYHKPLPKSPGARYRVTRYLKYGLSIDSRYVYRLLFQRVSNYSWLPFSGGILYKYIRSSKNRKSQFLTKFKCRYYDITAVIFQKYLALQKNFKMQSLSNDDFIALLEKFA